MRLQLLRLVLLILGLSASGCVYYNGMYNANRLASSARKAEREGRTFEANGLWGQVATKAESVMVRHPTSKYAAQAEILRGIALSRLGQCDQALGPLGRVSLTTVSTELTEDALLALGRCQLAAGNFEAADAAFSQLLQSKDADRRREARYQHARVLRQAGRHREALLALSGIKDPRADVERLLALAGAGQLRQADALADSLIAKTDSNTTRRWDSVLVALGDQSPLAASSLVDRIRTLPGKTKDAQIQLLLEDGLRLEVVDTARAARRFREAMALGGTGNAAGRAGLELVRLQLQGIGQPGELAPLLDSLRMLAGRFRGMADEILLFSSKIGAVHTAGGSANSDTAQGDLRLFLAAEAARDSLGSPRLAERMFRGIPDQFPFSAYAPKAILAVQQLNPAWSDSARALLDERYFDSPYLAMVRGEATPAYIQLEDSLGAFAAATMKPTVRRKPVGENEAGRPGRRRPAPRDTRVTVPQ